MNAHCLVFKGAPRWRDWIFWVVAIFGALVGWNLYRGLPLWPVLLWSPLYTSMLMRPHLFLSTNWLFYLSPFWILWRLQCFEGIESYSYYDGADNGQDVHVTLTLVRTSGPRRRNIFFSIEKGAQFDSFIAAMQIRGVPSLEEHVKDIYAEKTPSAVFSPPFANVEEERDALYQLLGRAKP